MGNTGRKRPDFTHRGKLFLILWLGFQCRKGRVLYINLEIDPISCVSRFRKIYEALGLPPKNRKDVVIWNPPALGTPEVETFWLRAAKDVGAVASKWDNHPLAIGVLTAVYDYLDLKCKAKGGGGT